jgi:hypothetical protein
MSLGLYVLGIALGAIGVMMVGFGIPINAFSLGNTLIIAGASTAAGGFVVIGLAAAVRQLNRIADALTRSGGRPAVRPSEAAEQPALASGKTVAAPAPGRVPFPPRPQPQRPEGREPRPDAPHRANEPRLAAAGIEPPEEVMVERPRPVHRSGEPPVMEDSGEVTLSPRPPFRPQPPAPSEASDFSGETRWPPAPALERLRNSGTAEPARNGSAETIARAPARSSGLFDSVWPASRNKSNAPENKESVRETPRPAPQRNEAPEAPEPHPVSILKSGVVDGMAYTLYTDGSIEAELAEGVVRFASIEELRTHLEKSQ